MNDLFAIIPEMAPPDEVDALMDELLAWCKAERGRQKELARELGVTEQVMSNWLSKRKTPSLKYWLQLQVYVKRIRRRRGFRVPKDKGPEPAR
jgi:predicted transcriptional regulator